MEEGELPRSPEIRFGLLAQSSGQEIVDGKGPLASRTTFDSHGTNMTISGDSALPVASAVEEKERRESGPGDMFSDDIFGETPVAAQKTVRGNSTVLSLCSTRFSLSFFLSHRFEIQQGLEGKQRQVASPIIGMMQRVITVEKF